uniref:Sortilin-related receptor n=1 Tax=Macrostomum lignano TaxID=282301 RepID=A0A1I8FAH4_9PLAT
GSEQHSASGSQPQSRHVQPLGKNVSVAEVKRRDSAGLLRRNLDRPVMKDTVIVPDGGYTGPGAGQALAAEGAETGPRLTGCNMTALGLAAAGAVLLAALLSVFLTRRFGLRSIQWQNIETVSEAVSYGSLKAPQLTF